MDRHTSYARIRSRLMDTCHVVSYDRRGYALSRDAEQHGGSMSEHVDDLEAIVAGRRCTLVGHSYGGAVVLSLAERRPDLVGAVLAYEPPLGWMDWWPSSGSRPAEFANVTPEQAAEGFLRRQIGDRRFELLPLTTREEILKDGPALVAELTAIRIDPPPFDPAKIVMPVLVVCGAESEERHQRASAWLGRELPAGSFHEVAGAGHGGHQSHPAEFTRLTLGAVALAADPAAERPPALV